MDINLTLSAAGTISNKIAVRVSKASTPSVVASMQQFDAPHTSPRNVTFTGLDPEVHIVNTYETVGDPVIGTLRHSFIYDPTFQQAVIKPSEFLKMTSGTASYTDSAWSGYEIDVIHRAGFGPLFVGEQIDYIMSGPNVIGFQLSQMGDTFAADEQITVTFMPKIVTVAPTVTSAKNIIADSIFTANTTLTAANAGKLLRIQGAGSTIKLTLPAIGSTDTFLTYHFVSDGGSHVMATIDIDGSGSLVLFGNKTEIYLAQGERATILYTGTDYVVLNECAGMLRVGEIVDSYDKDSTVQGCVFADGALLDRSVYARLWAYVQQLDSSLLVTEAAWANAANHAKYSVGDGTTTFRIPRLYTDGYARGVDGTTRYAGNHQDGAVLTHKHETDTYNATPSGSLFGGGGVIRNTGTFQNLLSGQTSLTNTPIKEPTTPGAGIAVDANENRTHNFGVFKLIRI